MSRNMASSLRICILIGLQTLFLLELVLAHGTITTPAFRPNPTVSGGWCPWCQGSQSMCDPSSSQRCAPPSPCWGATPGVTVSPEKFSQFKDTKAPDGTPWVDPAGGSGQRPAVWCPGTSVKYRFYINADHNGVYKWESQLAAPGKETELGFKNFTDWQSINNDPDTTYYLVDNGENKRMSKGSCGPSSKSKTWSPNIGHCRDGVFAEAEVAIPASLKPGHTVIRWIWYGAMTTGGQRVTGPEHSLFVNCVDVKIGTPAQCKSSQSNQNSVRSRQVYEPQRGASTASSTPSSTPSSTLKPSLNPTSARGACDLSQCLASCPSESGPWDGSFTKFTKDSQSFCSTCGNFGVAGCSFICAGGGSSGGGGGCAPSACSSGQYSFGSEGWEISMTSSQAGGKVPYRAFAYLPFCHGQKIGNCFSAADGFSFAVSFRTDSFRGWAAYAKLLFWTDSGNILGLLPPGAPGAQGNSSYRLIAFPKDDYPNHWEGEVVIEDGVWYDAIVTIKGSAVTVTVAGQTFHSTMDVDFDSDVNGPQLGFYSFDFSGAKRTSDSVKLTIGAVEGPGGAVSHHSCQYSCLQKCDNGVDPIDLIL